MNEYRAQKDRLEYEALMRSPETAYLASDEEFDRQLDELGWSPSEMVTMAGMYMDRTAYNIKKSVRDWFRELLEILFQAAGLIIDTLRTFFLIVLSILGPLAFAISVYDGFQSTLTQWFSRYISIYLWLPVSDLFSSVLARIQTLMLQKDIEQLSDPNFIPDGSSTIYVIFMIIGIVGYFTIPQWQAGLCRLAARPPTTATWQEPGRSQGLWLERQAGRLPGNYSNNQLQFIRTWNLSH